MENKEEKNIRQVKSSGPLFVASLARGMIVLECFGDGSYLLGITDIVRMTGFEKSDVQRLIKTLYDIGYLGKDHVQRKYYLTPKIISHSYNYLKTRQLFVLAMPSLIDLRDSLNKGVNLCVLNDTHLIYLIRLWTRFYHEYSLFGENIPAYCSAGGRILLSRLPEQQYVDIIERSQCKKLTRHTTVDKKELCTIISELKQKDFCWQVNQFIENEIGLAVPISDSLGTYATIIVSGLLKKVTPEACQDFMDEVLPQLQSTARSISRFAGALN